MIGLLSLAVLLRAACGLPAAIETDFKANLIRRSRKSTYHAAKGGELAVYAVLVQTLDHWKDEDMVEDAVRLADSARLLKKDYRSEIEAAVNHAIDLIVSAGTSRVPFHLLYIDLAEADVERLQNAGWQPHDMSDQKDYLKSIFKPVYDSATAHKLNRPWTEDNFVQHRVDGWATYLKFWAWKATDFERVLVVDMDVTFNISRPLEEVVREVPMADFLTSPETYSRRYPGLNTHLMLLRPSEETFARLIRRAIEGDYMPYTNTEQDILESHFDPHAVASKPIEYYIPNVNHR